MIPKAQSRRAKSHVQGRLSELQHISQQKPLKPGGNGTVDTRHRETIANIGHYTQQNHVL